MVGKTKTGQFTAGRDWIDVHAPFSPRGDHYHRFMGSSAGASASLTSYDWMSFAVADDGMVPFHAGSLFRSHVQIEVLRLIFLHRKALLLSDRRRGFYQSKD